MAKSGKRSAEEAFDEVQIASPGTKKQKKRRRHKKSQSNAEAATETPGGVKAPDHTVDADFQDLGDHEESVQPAIEPVAESHGGKSKKKRKREWKEKHAQVTTPKKEMAIDARQEEPSSPITEAVDQPEKMHKKRRRKPAKSHRRHADNDPEAQNEDGGIWTQNADEELEDQLQAASAMGSHTVESPKEVKLRRKREKKHKRKLPNDTDEVAEIEEEPTQGHEEVEEPAPEALVMPLEDRVETPKKSRKRKKRYRSGRPSQLIQRGDAGAEADEDAERMDVDADAVEVNSTPFEDRIEVPDSKKRRRTTSESMPQATMEADGDAPSADELNENFDEVEKVVGKRKRKQRRSNTIDYKSFKQWTISKGVGGIFIDQDPILTVDDQHLILATRTEVRIYSRSTSLLIRTLQLEARGHIVSCVLSSSDPSLLLAGSSKGSVVIWDWTDGNEIEQWDIHEGLKQIVSVSKEGDDHTLLAVHRHDSRYTLTTYRLVPGVAAATETAKLLDRPHVQNVQYFKESGLIVAVAGNQLVTGQLTLDISTATEANFSAHELKLPSISSSFDARIRELPTKRRKPRIDVAVGLSSGGILVYEDALYNIIGKEKQPEHEITSRKLHWHRNMVKAVKWSRDGNYIISGGSETTLVVWQLDTNQQQYLPHLSSPILNVSISSKGSAYALRLADNSVMVLGTADLVPSTNVSGLAASTSGHLVAALHPGASEKLLVACPLDTLMAVRSEDHATSLQTYDLSTDLQLSRQALTRNITTVVNADPEGRPLRQPNVSHLQLSADGKWLATIDEWQPNVHDLKALDFADESQSRREHAEIRLRFWTYNEEQGDWEHITRVDEPNSFARILSLQSSPTRAEFATIGADGIIQIWQPRARVRDGVHVRGAQGQQLYTWMNTTSINVPMHSKQEAKSAALAYSDDGSTIAVSVSLAQEGPQWTHLIDSQAGNIVHTVPDLVSVGERCLGFSGRYLVVLSKSLCIYDTVSAQVISRTELAKGFCTPDSSRYLSINRLDNAVAIGLNKRGKHGSCLTVIALNALDEIPLLEVKVSGQIRALLASPSTPGFVVVDGYSQIKRVKPPGQSRPVIASGTAEAEEVEKGLDRVFGRRQAVDTVVNGASAGAGTVSRPLTNGEDAFVGRTLEEALGFDNSAQAPAVDDLFERIAGVFARPVVAL